MSLVADSYYMVETPSRCFLGQFKKAEGPILKFSETITVRKQKYFDFLENGKLNFGQNKERRFVCDYFFPVHLFSAAIPVAMQKKPDLKAVKEDLNQSASPETKPEATPEVAET